MQNPITKAKAAHPSSGAKLISGHTISADEAAEWARTHTSPDPDCGNPADPREDFITDGW